MFRTALLCKSPLFASLFMHSLADVHLHPYNPDTSEPDDQEQTLSAVATTGLLILLLTGHSETVRGLTVGRDERFAQIDQRATAVTGLVVLVTLIVAWLVATARGQNGHPYDWLLAISGLSYLLAIAFFRWRG